MNLDDIPKELPARLPAQPFNIDVKRVLFKGLRYWYVFVISLALTLSYAYLKTRYAVKNYPVTASILIKEKEETSEGKLLYNNPLVSGYRNYENEPYLIKSYPLIQRTLEALNFGVAFYNEGKVLTTEIYDPQIKATVLKNGGDHRFYCRIINAKQYQLYSSSESNEFLTYSFGDTVTYQGLTFIFSSRSNARATINLNQPVVFTYSDPAHLTGSYVGALQASWTEEGAGVMDLRISGSNPQKDIDFINGLIQQYQEFDLDKKNQAATRTIEFIGSQLAIISDSLHLAERQLEHFKSQNSISDVSADAQRLSEQISSVEEQGTLLRIKANYYRYLRDYLQKDEFLDKIILPISIGINDPILSNFISKLIDLQETLRLNGTTDNPLVNEAKRKVSELKKAILESVKNQEAVDNINGNFIANKVKGFEKELSGLPAAERKLISFKRNYSFLESIYMFLLQKRAEAGISRASTTTDIDIVNPPMQAGGPTSPKPAQNYVFAFAAGLLFPALVFILMELLNSKVQSKEDVEKITSIPFIGGIGHKSGENNIEVLTKPKTAIAESFRALRSNLSYFLGKREKVVIIITSSISGEGKTFTSINLASVISLSDKKTLIVGADMRKPKLYSDLNLVNDVGLSSYLAGIANFDTIVQSTSYSNLDLISGGPVPPNPSELLLTNRMYEFLGEAKSRYDFVIIDTPPLAIVSDAFAFADYADHTLFVIRQNYTPIELIRTLDDSYRSGKLKNVSILLNDIYRTGHGYGYGYGYGYGGYGYGYGYGYQSKKNGYGYYSES